MGWKTFWKRTRREAGYVLMRATQSVICRCSRKTTLRAGGAIGWLGYRLASKLRGITRANLARAYPTLSLAERECIALGCFQNCACGFLETLRLRVLEQEDILRLIVNPEEIRACTQRWADGERCVFVMGHMGNWEWLGPAAAGLGLRVRPLARRIHFEKYDQLLRSLRLRHGVEQIDTDVSPREMLRALHRGQPVAFLGDQDIADIDGAFVPFFGQNAYTPTAPSSLACRLELPILVVALVREGDRFRFVSQGPFLPPTEGDRRERVEALTATWTAALETLIRRYPEQWAWMHERWKSDAARVERKRKRRTLQGRQL